MPAWLVYGIFAGSVLGLLAWEFWPKDAEGFWGGLALIVDVTIRALLPF